MWFGQSLGLLLGLKAQNIKQEDGSRAKLEVVFQAIDSDGSKGVSKVKQCTACRIVSGESDMVERIILSARSHTG